MKTLGALAACGGMDRRGSPEDRRAGSGLEGLRDARRSAGRLGGIGGGRQGRGGGALALMTAAALALACDASDDPADPGVSWHAHVAPILVAHCGGCHTEGGIGSFALDDYAGANLMKELALGAIVAGRMPPWGADSSVTDYRYDPSLSPEQIATLEAWIAAGGPEGDAATAAPIVPLEQATLSRVDRVLAMPEAYTPQLAPDDYRCFVIDWEGDEVLFVTGFDVEPGNPAVVHHVAAFLIPPDSIFGASLFDKLDEWQDLDELPGYTCFGGPSGDGTQIPVQQVSQWVPGAQGGDFPEGTGIQIKPGSKIVLQVHYNTLAAGPEPDLTSVKLRVDAEVERRGGFAPWLDVSWPAGGMHIAPGAVVTHSAQGDPRPIVTALGLIGEVNLDDGMWIHTIMLHLHLLGTAGRLYHIHAGGEELLLDVPRYDFHWQREYHLLTPRFFAPGDEIRVECDYDNSPENVLRRFGPGASPIDVVWGEGTNDEMCVANLYVSEP